MKRLRAPMAACLCFNLAFPALSLPAQTVHASTRNDAKATPPPQGDERILHALNRFTFGPRPGDLEAVRAMGLEKWFDRQLHPATLDNADLDLRLTQFPAMQETPQELLYRLPSNAIIRQCIDGKAIVPKSGVLHAIYANQIARVQLQRIEKEQEKIGQDARNLAQSPAVDRSTTATAMQPIQPAGPAIPPQMTSPRPQVGQQLIPDAQIALILDLPAQQRFAHLLAMPQPEFDTFRKALKPPQRAALTAGFDPVQTELVAALENPPRQVQDELVGQRLTRDIYSNAQLQEVMTDFWLNHFNIYMHKNEETPYYLVSFERDVIRPRALGSFEDLLEAAAHSPAMLLYLDNSSSMGPDSPNAERAKTKEARNPSAKPKARDGLNENYARELMELHTLGVNGGYSQADVTQVARVLTGWTVDQPQRGGAFKFDENRHEPGHKVVLGKKIDENGEAEGRQLLHLLATRPATARFLSRKLAMRFVSDNPPQKLVDRMAKSYLSSGGSISVVLKTLFHSPEFWAASNYRTKVKTPLEYLVSALRASDAATENLQPLANTLRDMGMPLYGSVPPTGYNWNSSAWVSTGALVNRMNFALSFASNRIPGTSTAWALPLSSNAVSTSAPGPEAEEMRLEALLVAGGVSDSTRSAVMQQFLAQSTQNPPAARLVAAAGKAFRPAQIASALEKQDQLLAGLLLGSPEFQRR